MGKIKGYENEIFQLLLNYIDNNGYRMTSQRKMILLEFILNKEEHLSAEDIYEKLKAKGLGMSTIYRNINLFVGLAILKELKIEDTSYYELKMYAQKSLHIHFVCDECGTIADIKREDIILQYLKINHTIESNYGIQINDLDIMFHGLCSECIKKHEKAEVQHG